MALYSSLGQRILNLGGSRWNPSSPWPGTVHTSIMPEGKETTTTGAFPSASEHRARSKLTRLIMRGTLVEPSRHRRGIKFWRHVAGDCAEGEYGRGPPGSNAQTEAATTCRGRSQRGSRQGRVEGKPSEKNGSLFREAHLREATGDIKEGGSSSGNERRTHKKLCSYRNQCAPKKRWYPGRLGKKRRTSKQERLGQKGKRKRQNKEHLPAGESEGKQRREREKGPESAGETAGPGKGMLKLTLSLGPKVERRVVYDTKATRKGHLRGIPLRLHRCLSELRGSRGAAGHDSTPDRPFETGEKHKTEKKLPEEGGRQLSHCMPTRGVRGNREGRPYVLGKISNKKPRRRKC